MISAFPGYAGRMVHETPELTGDDLRVLDELAVMREELKRRIAVPGTWTRLLRRSLTAAAIAGSNALVAPDVPQRAAPHHAQAPSGQVAGPLPAR